MDTDDLTPMAYDTLSQCYKFCEVLRAEIGASAADFKTEDAFLRGTARFLKTILEDPEDYLDSWNLLDETDMKSFAEGLVIPCRAAYCGHVMSITEVRQLPLAEKLQIMEAIWEDLRAQAEQVPVPAWHQELLDERRKAVEEGREEVLDWDSIKDSLGPRRKS